MVVAGSDCHHCGAATHIQVSNMSSPPFPAQNASRADGGGVPAVGSHRSKTFFCSSQLASNVSTNMCMLSHVIKASECWLMRRVTLSHTNLTKTVGSSDLDHPASNTGDCGDSLERDCAQEHTSMMLAPAYRIAHGVLEGLDSSLLRSVMVVVGADADAGGEMDGKACCEKCLQWLLQARAQPAARRQARNRTPVPHTIRHPPHTTRHDCHTLHEPGVAELRHAILLVHSC
jgi:hypothetical protein